MEKLSIIGNSNPEIGIPQEYSILDLFTYELPKYIIQNQDDFVWDIYVLEKRGWRKTIGNTKKGKTVSYTFTHKSLTRKQIKIVVEQKNKRGELIIKTRPTKTPKILKVELLDINGKEVNKPLSYMDTLVARASCVDMEGDNISFTLYEDDAKYTGHNDFNEANKIISISSVVKKGVAEAKFPMAQYYWASTIANLRTAKEDKNEGTHHEYYVTAEYYGKKKQNKASNNVNIKNEVPNNKTEKTTQQKTSPQKNTYQIPLKPDAKPKSTDPEGRILKVSFCDKKGNPLKVIKRTEGFVAKIETQKLIGKTLKLIVWEDDDIGKDQKVWEADIKVTKDVIEKTITITQEIWKKGDNLGEFKDQEYKLEVIYSDQVVRSKEIEVLDNAPPTKPETGKSTSKVAQEEKENFERVHGLGKEAVLFISSEIATEIKVDKNGNLVSYPDHGKYNGILEYKENGAIYSKKLSNSHSVFPLYKMYIYRGNKEGEAIKKLKQDLKYKTHENAETTILSIARHTGKNNQNYKSQGPTPPNSIDSLYRIKYKRAYNHRGFESFRYRIVDDILSNFPEVNISKEVDSGNMSIGNRSSISIDPWKSAGLVGCIGIRNSNGGHHESYASRIKDTNNSSKYKFIYHTLNNYLESIIPELTGVYGRRGYSFSGEVNIIKSAYDKEVKVFALIEPLPEINNCLLNLKKDGRQQFYEEFGKAAIKMVQDQKKSNKYKGLYMVAQRRQENGFNLNVPNNNPMNIKSNGDLGKSDLYTREVINGKEIFINDGFGKFSTVEKGFEGYLELLKQNFYDAYIAIIDDTKSIDSFLSGLQDTGRKGVFATDPNYKTSIKTIFNSVVKDYKEILNYELCKSKTETEKNRIMKDIELLNKLK